MSPDYKFVTGPTTPIDATLFADSIRDQFGGLVVCLSHSWGGLEQVAANDAIELGNLGLIVRVLCLEGSPIHENLAHRKEVTVVPLSFRPRNNFDLKMRSELNRLIRNGTNLIHTHQTSILGSIVPWIWSSPDVALFATRHIMSGHNKKDFYHRALYGRLDALIVMSQALRDNVLDTHPIREKNVKVVTLGLDFERFDPEKVNSGAQRMKWGADKDTLVIGQVGRIDPAKGQATFIRAAAGLMKNPQFAKQNVKFVIVGEETLGSASTHLGELKEMVAQFGLESSVIFAGYQENIPEVMRSFDVFVMPSRQEAFGLVAIEAMAMECPIVISSGGSSEEIIGDEEFGLTMRPDDAFDLQRQLKFLLERSEERVRMGKRAREHVRANYDRRARLVRTLELYAKGLKRRSRY